MSLTRAAAFLTKAFLATTSLSTVLLAAALLAAALLLATAPPLAAQGGASLSHASQSRAHPFPPALERGNAMRAPGLRSGPRLPLGSRLHTGYLALVRAPATGPAQPLALGPLAFYRTVMSPVNGSFGDLAPVPSLYSVQAIKTHGVLLGSVLAAERLLHEPSVVPTALRFQEDGREFRYDPLAWNTYWLPPWLGGSPLR